MAIEGVKQSTVIARAKQAAVSARHNMAMPVLCMASPQAVFHDIGAAPAEQHDAAVVAQLFNCRVVVWWRIRASFTG